MPHITGFNTDHYHHHHHYRHQSHYHFNHADQSIQQWRLWIEEFLLSYPSSSEEVEAETSSFAFMAIKEEEMECSPCLLLLRDFTSWQPKTPPKQRYGLPGQGDLNISPEKIKSQKEEKEVEEVEEELTYILFRVLLRLLPRPLPWDTLWGGDYVLCSFSSWSFSSSSSSSSLLPLVLSKPPVMRMRIAYHQRRCQTSPVPFLTWISWKGSRVRRRIK